MAINPETLFAGKIAPATANYPYGGARNVTVPGDGTGTPWDAALVNDIFGFQQAVLEEAGIVPSGSPETALLSQYLRALNKTKGKVLADFDAIRALDTSNLAPDTACFLTAAGAGGPGVLKTGATANDITGVTQTNPAVVTYSGADNWSNGDTVHIQKVIGMTELNGNRYTVANVNTAANTFQLSGVDSTAYAAYSSGGVVSNDDGGTIIVISADWCWSRSYNGTIDARWFGVEGNNPGAPYDVTTLMRVTDVKRIEFPNKPIYIDNSGGGFSFQSDVIYEGGPDTVFIINTNSQRAFATSSKTNFVLRHIRVNGLETAGSEDTYIGGGYLRFDSCTNFILENCEASNSFGTGLKCVLCSDFTIRDWKSNYNQFSGFELEGCASYLVENWESSKNGRYSATDGFKPLPTGWTGTHGGRAWVVSASGTTVDQKSATIGKGVGRLNSEYGGRAFAASTRGVTNLNLRDQLLEDNGAPAGTYGTVVLGSAKGVDLLINSDAVGASSNIQWEAMTVNRSLGYGVTIQVDGNDHRQRSTKVRLTGAAQHAVVACAVFGGTGFVSDGLDSDGPQYHVSFGSGAPGSVTFRNCKGANNLRAFNGNPSSGVNKLEGGTFVHRAAVAVAGEFGIAMNATRWNIKNTTFDGYYRGIEPQGTAPVGEVINCATFNTVFANGGFYANSVTDQSNLSVESNNFDSSFPGIFSTMVHNRRGSLNRILYFWNSTPAGGGANAGGNIAWSLGDKVINTAGVVGAPKGWVCTTAGTPGAWTSEGNL